ncbi:MAG: DUF1566 domain-containing protein [Bacteroidetes bacterium]|nr:DUF1566 domain-containing protein [Bacteroidota bacterium]
MNDNEIKIFVSYSHKNSAWVDKSAEFNLIPFIEQSLKWLGVSIWYDTDLKTLPGVEYEEKIKNEIDTANIAILLLSRDFINSDFIINNELPWIKKRNNENTLEIVPILVEPWTLPSGHPASWLVKTQIIPGDPTPLIEFTDSKRNFLKARNSILTSLERTIERIKYKGSCKNSPPKAEEIQSGTPEKNKNAIAKPESFDKERENTSPGNENVRKEIKIEPIPSENSYKIKDEFRESRFVELKLGNESVVIDSETRLMWQISNLPNSAYFFKEAINWIATSNAISYAGFSDWRLPTIDEGTSIISKKKQRRQDVKYHKAEGGEEIFLDTDIFPDFLRIWTEKTLEVEGKKLGILIDFVSGKYLLEGPFGGRYVMGVRNFNPAEENIKKLLQEASKEKNKENSKYDLGHKIEANRKSDFNSIDVNLDKQVREIIDDMDLRFSHSGGYYPGSGGSTNIVDKNSELVFRDLRKLKRDTEIIKILCNLIEDETEDSVLVMKVLKLLSYYRSPMCMNNVQLLANVEFKHPRETDLIHLECLKYFRAVSSPSNKNEISEIYKAFALHCKSIVGRRDAITFLSEVSNKSDKEIIELLFELTDDPNLVIRYTAIKTLKEFRITYYSDKISDLLQDPDSKIRTETITLMTLNKYPLEIDFKTIASFIEIETDRYARLYAFHLINKKYPEEEERYFLKLLDQGTEEYVEGVLNVYRHRQGGDYLVAKTKELKDQKNFSENIVKLIDEFLQKQK